MKIKNNLLIICLLSLLACQRDIDVEQTVQIASLTASVQPFEGEEQTRANMAGTAFEVGDWIRMKLICPFAPDTMDGETYSDSHDSFWLLKYKGSSNLGPLEASDGCDINGDFIASNAPDLTGQRLSQQTPYVFTAQTWNEEVSFYFEKKLYLHYGLVFQADQSRADGRAYKRNDLLWAQETMQTGTPHVHLTFKHKMAALAVTIDDSAVTAAGNDPISSDAVLTLSGMPDIDQMELVVGDYYADKDASGRLFGYKEQSSCSYENNGKFLGVVVLDQTSATKRAMTYSLSGTATAAGGEKNNQIWGTIQNEGVYTAYHDTDAGVYRLIVPPCVLADNPVFYLRDKDRRYKVVLGQKAFEQGKMYKVTLKLQ